MIIWLYNINSGPPQVIFTEKKNKIIKFDVRCLIKLNKIRKIKLQKKPKYAVPSVSPHKQYLSLEKNN